MASPAMARGSLLETSDSQLSRRGKQPPDLGSRLRHLLEVVEEQK